MTDGLMSHKCVLMSTDVFWPMVSGRSYENEINSLLKLLKGSITSGVPQDVGTHMHI